MNTRTVLLWHNNGEERIYFTVNPARLTVTRPNENRVRSLAMGGTVNIWGGRGLREVRLTTFLPSAYSPFFDGKEPESVLAMLKSWDRDVGLTVTLREYKFKSALAALAGGSGGSGSAPVRKRTDERVTPQTYTVKKGDTLWDIACRFYGDGTKWGRIAAKNGVTNPRKLQIGKVLTL